MKAKEIVQAILAVSSYAGMFYMIFTSMEIPLGYWGLILGWSGLYGWKAVKGG